MTESQASEPLQGKSWNNFYEKTSGREVRPLLIRTLELMESADQVPGFAVELGCGDGTDTAELLRRGWRVLGIDASEEGITRTRARAESLGLAESLETRHAKFEELDGLPKADLVYSAVSLPFCPPDHFGDLWNHIRYATAPGGWIAVQLFGPHDTWFGTPGLNFHSREEVEGLIDGLKIRAFEERDEDGQAVSGPKHWHIFDVIAVDHADAPGD